MVQCTPVLITAITQAPEEIFAELFAAFFMSDSERCYMHNNAHDKGEKAAKLISTMTDRIKVKRSEFYTFMDILKKKQWTRSIAQVLETALALAKN